MTDKRITSEVFVAYSQCPRKAFLLLFSDDQGTPHDYPRILEERRKAHQTEYLEAFKQIHEDAKPYDERNLRKSKFLVEATLKVECWEAYCDVLTQVNQGTSSRKVLYEPTIIIGTYSMTKEQKTELLFIGKVLGQIQKQLPAVGAIVRMDGKTHRVQLDTGYKSVAPFLKILEAWMEEMPAESPALILNKHCPSCQFRHICREQAEKENNLSLLDRMTPKAIQQYNKKGIFTVQQLSYLFKPRRSRKRKTKAPVKHSLELQALAIREQKIYIQELPQLTRKPVELFLDIEGIPDQSFHYLIGLLVCEGENKIYHPFWADTANDEQEAWEQFIEKLNNYPEAPIYHYGSYEVRAINELAKRYSKEDESVKERLVNLNSYTYGKVYFPTYSNSLKKIGNSIGIAWDDENASGLQSLVWRYKWEESHDARYQQKLTRYNQDDCNALMLLADEFCKIAESSEFQSNIDFADRPKKVSTEAGKQIHKQFDTILKFAHADYEKKKISIRKENSDSNIDPRKRGGQKGHKGYTRAIPAKTNRIVYELTLEKCPRCNIKLLEELNIKNERIVIDLVFSRSGCKKKVVKYISYKGYLDNVRFRKPLLEKAYSHKAPLLIDTILNYRRWKAS